MEKNIQRHREKNDQDMKLNALLQPKQSGHFSTNHLEMTRS